MPGTRPGKNPTKPRFFLIFFSAAQPTDQGEESVVLVVVVGGGGGAFCSFPCTVFWGVKRQNLFLRRGVKRQNLGQGCQKAKAVYIMVH